MSKKITAIVLILALLCAGGLFAKTEYDKWHAAQPYPLGSQVLSDLAKTFPEAFLQTDLLGHDDPETGDYTLQVFSTSNDPAGEIVLGVKGYNLLKLPLYEVKAVRGLVSTEVTGAKGSSFTVDGRGYDYAQTPSETPLFDGLTSSVVGGLFSDLQIVPAEGYQMVKPQEGCIFLTVPAAEDEAGEIRRTASKETVLGFDAKKESVTALQMTDPLFLSEDEAVVYVRSTHGASDDEQEKSDVCCCMKRGSGGVWTVSDQTKGQASLMGYTDEAVYEIPAPVLPPEGRALSHPYYVMVNRQMNTVTVYTKDEEGKFTVPYKAMICSTGRAGHETPTGNFAVMSFKAAWCYMIDGSYGQYATGFLEGGYLFHSICYTAKDKASMMADEYNMLGGFASAGCVRLQTADAKWIFDNCEVGTGVTVYDGPDAGPLGKPEKAVPEITEENNNGWDPTDPDPDNPWYRGN
ncbi:MAG: L,D-transpeptidase [Firmicutes bacterium]|nr:L,D-transpeptidase [Bacillota bacterium]